jgi:hypothetical protein
MSRSKSMAAIAAVCMIVIAGAVAWAQGEGRDSCVDDCQQAKARCVATCDTHDNPVECDEACQDTAQGCVHQCR